MSSVLNLGRISPNHLGAYNEATQYGQLDEVFYLGSTYRVKVGVVPPVGTIPTNMAYWVKTSSAAAPISNVEIEVNNEDNYAYDITFTVADGSTFTVTTGNLRGLPGEIPEGSELITLLQAVDGVGSGLDADLLRGRPSSATATESSIVQRTSDGDAVVRRILTENLSTSAEVTQRDSDTVFYTSDGDIVYKNNAAGTLNSLDVYTKAEVGTQISNAFTSFSGNDILTKLLTVDGVGSGLDADTLDGYSSSAFLLSSSYTAADVLAKLLTVDGAGSGIDADTLDGLNTSESATVSTIAVRDSSGDLTARNYIGEGLSLSHAVVSTNTDSVFFSSSGNEIRKNDAAGFRNSLSVYSKAEVDATVGGGVRSYAFPKGGQAYIGSIGANYAWVKLPVSANSVNMMITLVIDIYNFDTGTVTNRIKATGYCLSNAWQPIYCYSQMETGNNNFSIRWVTFGDSRLGLALGETNTGWAYTRVVVTEVITHYIAGETLDLSSGWEVGYGTSIGTVAKTETVLAATPSLAQLGGLPNSGGTVTGNITLDGTARLLGGFGSVTTNAGTSDWNDYIDGGSGLILLHGNDTNGPTSTADYFHPFNFVYANSGNLTQLAIPYAAGGSDIYTIYMRTKNSSTWTAWQRIISTDISGNVTIPGGLKLPNLLNGVVKVDGSGNTSALALGNLATSNVTVSSSSPSGGNNGDIWFKV